ncbi:hypothetical protein QQP08_019551 [Theobroma cacao]|nr:hypothetical protein QQP08_019551 [Theobroma cacao]
MKLGARYTCSLSSAHQLRNLPILGKSRRNSCPLFLDQLHLHLFLVPSVCCIYGRGGSHNCLLDHILIVFARPTIGFTRHISQQTIHQDPWLLACKKLMVKSDLIRIQQQELE